jgi:hypothetical protein
LGEGLRGLAERVRGKVTTRKGRLHFKPGVEELLEKLRYESVEEYAGELLGEAVSWSKALLEEAYRASVRLGAKGILFPKELRSFLSDPQHHLAKKLFQYSIDLARGKIGVDEYLAKARSAVSTSARTNMRSIYQYWVFLGVASILAERGAEMIYPEHGYIHIERSGRQRGGSIPANLALRMPGRGVASFYVEAPRPVGWGDSRDLKRVWKLYVSLRPDMIVYRGLVLDMVEYEGGEPRIRRPSLIVECKELSDWYERTRYLKGSLAKPLTAEEWYSRWWTGLVEGLGDILGVKEAVEALREEKAVKVKEHRLVLLYREVYRPEKMILVSRVRVPHAVRSDLESHGVEVIDGVEIGNRASLSPVADAVEEFFGGEEPGWGLEEVEALLARAGVRVSRERLSKAIAALARAHMDELIRILEGSQG